MREVLDPEILDALDQLNGATLERSVWRVAWVSRDPLAGSSGGGRWSPADSFEVLYASLERDGAIAEARYHLSRAPVLSSSHKRLYTIDVKLVNVLNIETSVLNELGIEDPCAPRVDYALTQPIGEAAHMLDYEGMLVPSARWECKNLVLFLDRVDLNTQVIVRQGDDINWPAWEAKYGVR